MVYDINSQNLLSAVGALYDIVGAILLARALLFVKARDLYRQATSGYGGFSGPLLKMFAEQKVEAIFGLGALSFGFALQAVASFGFHSDLRSRHAWVLMIILAALLGTSVVCYFVLRHRLTKRFFLGALRSNPHPLDPAQPRLTEEQIEAIWESAQTEKQS